MKRMAQTLQVAFTYIGTVVGAGFASGQEILQFFTRFGWMALFTIMLSTILFIWLGVKLLLLARDWNAQSLDDFNRILFGKRIGNGISWFTLAILFGVSSVMLAGAGTLFSEQLHLSYQSGLLITIILSYAVLSRGIQAILTVNTIVVPVMLCFTIIVVYATQSVPQSGNWLHLSSDYSSPAIWFSPLFYVAFNLASAQAVLIPLAATTIDRSVLVRGGILGGTVIGLMMLAAHYALSAHMPGITQFEIPMAQMITRLGSMIQLMYLLVIFGEIFTTYVADLYGVMLQLKKRTRLPQGLILPLLLGSSYMISQIGFASLLSLLYPLFGFVSMIWLTMVIARRRSPML